jgi:hypothetical protein
VSYETETETCLPFAAGSGQLRYATSRSNFTELYLKSDSVSCVI